MSAFSTAEWQMSKKLDVQPHFPHTLIIADREWRVLNKMHSSIDISKLVEVYTIPEQQVPDLLTWCYPEFFNPSSSSSSSSTSSSTSTHEDIGTHEKAILCPLNADVDEVNEAAIQMLQGESHELCSSDILKNDKDQDQVPIEFLNSIQLNGFPPHLLSVKEGCPLILLRNLDSKNGLCNGTKLVLINIVSLYAIRVRIVSGSHAGTEVILPRINFTSGERDFPFIFTRRQFPVRLAFALTINKAQGQSYKRVGIYLPQPVFSHGQLYVALSRAGNPFQTRVLMKSVEGKQGAVTINDIAGIVTSNVVWKEVFLRPT